MEGKRKTIVRTGGDELKHVKDMSDMQLIDAFSCHTDFSLGALDLITDACDSPSGGNPERMRPVAHEIIVRLKYAHTIGNELHRRLAEAKKEKAA